MNFVGLFILFFNFLVCFPLQSKGNECVDYFSEPSLKIISKNEIQIIDKGFVKTSQGKVFIKVEKPKGEVKQWLILLHGLLDSHRGWNELTPYLLGAGYGVVRFDLIGHGKTFYNQYKDTLASTEEYKVPYKISHSENKQLLLDVVSYLDQNLGIRNPVLIGHSMGGAVALESSLDLMNRIDKVVLIAPYVYRLEKRALEKTFSSYFWGFNTTFFEMFPDIYREFLERWLTDFFSDSVLYEHYKNFAEEKILEENAHLNKDQLKKMIRYHIRSGLAITKGLRDFNGLDIARNISSQDAEIKFLVLIGNRDELLDIPLERRLAKKLPKSQFRVIPRGNHMMINEMPEKVARQILEFLGYSLDI